MSNTNTFEAPLLLLFDGDMLVFETTSACEKEMNWEGDLWVLYSDAGEAKSIIDDRVQSITNKVLEKTKHVGPYEIVMCFTDDTNFRKKLLPTYKANRIGKRKPLAYSAVKQWVKDNYNSYQRPHLEADDCMGILATLKQNTVVISGDKDFKCVPGRFFNYRKNDFMEISEVQADYWHMFQTLIGDTADNYAGCPGIGEKTAEKLLEAVVQDCTPWADDETRRKKLWEVVVAQFVKKGLTESDALLQAQVARILRKADYDLKNKEVVLWEPVRPKKQ
jgi:DNA polymerase-1